MNERIGAEIVGNRAGADNNLSSTVKNLLGKWFSNAAATDGESSPKKILTDVLETMRAAAVVVNADKIIIASNRAAYNAFARGNGELPGKRLTEVIRDLSVHDAFRQTLETGGTTEKSFEFTSGEKRIYEMRVTSLEVEAARHAVGIFYDSTQIEKLENVRREFLSNVSHELRTPLTSIIAFVETLEDGALEDEANNRRFLSVIRKNAERMHRLIDDIGELSSIEAGNISIFPIALHPAKKIDEIFTNLSNKAAARRITLVNEISHETTVRADATRFDQMLTNLIDNAVKFNREAGTVTVSHRRTATHDVIAVADTGDGIAAEHLSRIFERFYRTDKARSREIGGTGLGLAIVKHLARLHHGEANVESVVGRGSTFTVELPHA